MIETGRKPQIGDITPCESCGHVKETAIRLHAIACAGLGSHTVQMGYIIMEMADALAHRWRDEGTYSAVRSDRPISEADALSWLERAHAGEVERRPYRFGEMIAFDAWTDADASD